MIIPDRKKMATMIVAEHLHGGPEEETTEASGDSYTALAEEVLAAVKSGSASALADALKAFHAECESGEYEEG